MGEDSAIHSDDSFDFMDDDDSDDDDESDSVDPILQRQDDKDDIDDFIVDDHRFYDDIVHENRLQIEYSLNLNATDSVLLMIIDFMMTLFMKTDYRLNTHSISMQRILCCL